MWFKENNLKMGLFQTKLILFCPFHFNLKKNNIKELKSYSVLLSYVYTCSSVVILFAIIVMKLVNNLHYKVPYQQ